MYASSVVYDNFNINGGPIQLHVGGGCTLCFTLLARWTAGLGLLLNRMQLWVRLYVQVGWIVERSGTLIKNCIVCSPYLPRLGYCQFIHAYSLKLHVNVKQQ